MKIVEGDLIQGVETTDKEIDRVLDPEDLKKEWPRLLGMIKGTRTCQ